MGELVYQRKVAAPEVGRASGTVGKLVDSRAGVTQGKCRRMADVMPDMPLSTASQVVQRVLIIDRRSPEYLDAVKKILQELSGGGAKVLVDSKTGEVSVQLLQARPSKRIKQSESIKASEGSKLLLRLIRSGHTTTILHDGKAEASCEPLAPPTIMSVLRRCFDQICGPGELEPDSNDPVDAEAFKAGGGHTQGVDGVDTRVWFDPNVPADKRNYKVGDDGTEEQELPMALILGHELIHADHFTRGVAAYAPSGKPIMVSAAKRSTKRRSLDNSQEIALEEANTVGLELSTNETALESLKKTGGFIPKNRPENEYKTARGDQDEKAMLTTEQKLREQMGLKRRYGYFGPV